MDREKIEKIQVAMSLLEEENNSEYENLCKKLGYLKALRDYKLISFKEAFQILKDL